MKFEQLRKRLNKYVGQLPELARVSKVPLSTINKIRYGIYDSCKTRTSEALEDAMLKMEKKK